MHAQRIGAGAVDLVDDNNGCAAQLKRFPQHETRLRHWAIKGIYNQKHPFDHAQNTLHFTAKIGVTGRIDDIDFGVAPMNGCVLREDGNSALFFERVGIHHAFFNDLIFTKSSGLAEHLIHERCLAVVDVCDNCDVADLHSLES